MHHVKMNDFLETDVGVVPCDRRRACRRFLAIASGRCTSRMPELCQSGLPSVTADAFIDR